MHKNIGQYPGSAQSANLRHNAHNSDLVHPVYKEKKWKGTVKIYHPSGASDEQRLHARLPVAW
jgi:hypothetical protein